MDIVLTESRPLIIHFRLTEPGKIPHRLCSYTETQCPSENAPSSGKHLPKPRSTQVHYLPAFSPAIDTPCCSVVGTAASITVHDSETNTFHTSYDAVCTV